MLIKVMIRQKNDVALKIMFHLGHAHQKFRNLFLENAEDLDFVMQMHNLLEYIHSYFMTSRLLHNRYRDEIDNIGDDDDDDDDDVSNGKSFKYKTKITGTEERNICTRW